MPTYIAEFYLSRTRRAELSSLAAQARDTAEALAAEGIDVAHLRSAYVPEDEICQHRFAASSSAVVTEVARQAQLEWDRVIAELERPPKEQPCAPESA